MHIVIDYELFIGDPMKASELETPKQPKKTRLKSIVLRTQSLFERLSEAMNKARRSKADGRA